MSRLIDHDTREKHRGTIDALLRMLAGLRVTLKAGERIGQLQATEARHTIHAAVRELNACGTFESQMLKRISDDLMPNHPAQEAWLTRLAIDLALSQNIPEVRAEVLRPITLERLAEGRKLVGELSACRESLIFYR